MAMCVCIYASVIQRKEKSYLNPLVSFEPLALGRLFDGKTYDISNENGQVQSMKNRLPKASSIDFPRQGLGMFSKKMILLC